jgi:integrase
MTAIFNAADSLVAPRRIMNSLIFIVPALIRLLYGTGLRVGEALSLQNKDVNLIGNFIIIKDSKNSQQRMIPISESLAVVCRDYINHRGELPILQTNESPFFISLNGSACLPHTFYRYFRLVLKSAEIPYIGNNHGPRVHDLRHSFAVASLAKMAESGIDLYTSLPVLSTYLGHQSLSSTNTYVRLTAEMYPGLLKDVDMVCLNVFPNVEKYETD